MFRPIDLSRIYIGQVFRPSRGPIAYLKTFLRSQVDFLGSKTYMFIKRCEFFLCSCWLAWVQTPVHLKTTFLLHLCVSASAKHDWKSCHFDPLHVLIHSASQNTAQINAQVFWTRSLSFRYLDVDLLLICNLFNFLLHHISKCSCGPHWEKTAKNVFVSLPIIFNHYYVNCFLFSSIKRRGCHNSLKFTFFGSLEIHIFSIHRIATNGNEKKTVHDEGIIQFFVSDGTYRPYPSHEILSWLSLRCAASSTSWPASFDSISWNGVIHSILSFCFVLRKNVLAPQTCKNLIVLRIWQ